MDSIRVSEAPDSGSIPDKATIFYNLLRCIYTNPTIFSCINFSLSNNKSTNSFKEVIAYKRIGSMCIIKKIIFMQ